MKPMTAALLLTIGLSPAARAAGALDGAWLLNEDLGPDARYTLLCALATRGAVVSGDCVPLQAKASHAAGRLEGAHFKLHYLTDYNGSGLKQEMSGTVDANGTITGDIENRMSSGQFSGSPMFQREQQAVRTWRFDIGFSGMRYIAVCMLRQDGARLDGPCAATAGATAHLDGQAGGAGVTFSLRSQLDGQAVGATLVGRMIDDATISGTVSAPRRQGRFQMSKQ